MIPKCAETPSQLWIEKYVFITIYLSLSFGAQETYNGYKGQGRWPKVQLSLFQKPIYVSSNSFRAILVHFCYEICMTIICWILSIQLIQQVIQIFSH